MYKKQLQKIIKEDFEIAILNLLQDERIWLLIDGKKLTGKEALKLPIKKIMKEGQFEYREGL